MVYGGWSKGYSSGGFNQDVRMRAYEPEVSKNWELGIKSTWLDRRLRANLTTFYNTYENQQLTIGRLVEGQPTADLINAQEASLWGIEGEFTLLLDNWLFSANFGWMDGEYEEFLVEDNLMDENFQSIIVVRDVSDTEVVRRAPYTVGLSAAYTLRLAGGGEVVPQIGYFHRGRTYNTLEAFDISRQKAYGLLDGRVTWRLADQPHHRVAVGHQPAGQGVLPERHRPVRCRPGYRDGHQVLGAAAPLRSGVALRPRRLIRRPRQRAARRADPAASVSWRHRSGGCRRSPARLAARSSRRARSSPWPALRMTMASIITGCTAWLPDTTFFSVPSRDVEPLGDLLRLAHSVVDGEVQRLALQLDAVRASRDTPPTPLTPRDSAPLIRSPISVRSRSTTSMLRLAISPSMTLFAAPPGE
jgi:hypothetical protein